MLKFNCVLHTAGNGYWSNTAKKVVVERIMLAYVNDEQDFGELRVYFNTASWDVDKHGLIYTDKLFLQQLQDVLTQAGLDGADVDYSEQGMQGDNFVSLDVGEAFINSYTNIVGEVV